MTHRTRNQRPQASKVVRTNGNRALAKAMQELRRSSAAEPHRNRARYSRSDERNARQRGWK